MQVPIVKCVSTTRMETPEVIGIQYDLWVLRVVLSFPEVRAPTYVDFEAVSGFRVLDEGDLLEFWRPKVRQPGWLWNVTSGGWLSVESTRSGFSGTGTLAMREYLVAGINDCVSVFSGSEPIVHEPAL